MRQLLFGECLGRLVSLSGHDVAEILEDQTASRRRFGEIALSWQLCSPQQVWRAWCQQLAQGVQQIDLDSIGIDTQALAFIPRHLALRYHVIPFRSLGDELIVATAQEHLSRATTELPGKLKKHLRFVLTDPEQLRSALRAHYPQKVLHSEAD